MWSIRQLWGELPAAASRSFLPGRTIVSRNHEAITASCATLSAHSSPFRQKETYMAFHWPCFHWPSRLQSPPKSLFFRGVREYRPAGGSSEYDRLRHRVVAAAPLLDGLGAQRLAQPLPPLRAGVGLVAAATDRHDGRALHRICRRVRRQPERICPVFALRPDLLELHFRGRNHRLPELLPRRILHPPAPRPAGHLSACERRSARAITSWSAWAWSSWPSASFRASTTPWSC